MFAYLFMDTIELRSILNPTCMPFVNFLLHSVIERSKKRKKIYIFEKIKKINNPSELSRKIIEKKKGEKTKKQKRKIEIHIEAGKICPTSSLEKKVLLKSSGVKEIIL